MKINKIILYIIIFKIISCSNGIKNDTQIRNDLVTKSIKNIIRLYDEKNYDNISNQYCSAKIMIRGSLDQDGIMYVSNTYNKSYYIKILLSSDFIISNNQISNYKKLSYSNILDLDVIENNKIRWHDIIFEYNEKSHKYVISGFYLDSSQLGRDDSCY